MDKEGRFYRNDYQELLAFKDSLPVITAQLSSLASLLIDGRLCC